MFSKILAHCPWIFPVFFGPSPSLIQGLPCLGVRFHPFQAPGGRGQVGISGHRDEGVGAQGGIDAASSDGDGKECLSQYTVCQAISDSDMSE